MQNQEIIDIVNSINDLMYDEETTNEFITSGYRELEYIHIHWCNYVKYLGMNIWSDDYDDRDYIDDSDTREPLKSYLIRKINEINKSLGNIKL